jgi:hypothetical protein
MIDRQSQMLFNPDVCVDLLEETDDLFRTVSCLSGGLALEEFSIEHDSVPYLYLYSVERTGEATMSWHAPVAQDFLASWESSEGTFMHVEGQGLLRSLRSDDETISVRYLDLDEITLINKFFCSSRYQPQKLGNALFTVNEEDSSQFFGGDDVSSPVFRPDGMFWPQWQEKRFRNAFWGKSQSRGEYR